MISIAEGVLLLVRYAVAKAGGKGKSSLQIEDLRERMARLLQCC